MKTALSLVLLCAAVLAVLVIRNGNVTQRNVLFADDGIESDTIGMDHNAMLATDPRKNAAFLRVFGNYLGRRGTELAAAKKPVALAAVHQKALAAVKPAREIQLAQMPSKSAGRGDKQLAASLQQKLTASSEGDGVVTPHFVAALEAIGPDGVSTLGEEDRQSAARQDPNSGIALQAQMLGSHQVMEEVASEPQGSSSAQADDALLAASSQHSGSAKDLIKKAALQQMQQIAPQLYAPTQQLAQPPTGMYPAQPQWVNGPARLAGYQAPPSRNPAYATPSFIKHSKYQTPQQAAIAQMEKLGLDRTMASHVSEGLMQQQPPAAALQAANAKALKAEKIKEQMAALRQSILSDYNKNTAAALKQEKTSQALLSSPVTPAM